MEEAIVNFYRAKLALCGLAATPAWVYVSLVHQKLWVVGPQGVKSYRCSTSLKPASCQYGSGGTPLGLHEVAEKVGQGAAWGTIFKQREPVRVFDKANPGEEGLITTRLLWLKGLEEGKNLGYACGSHNRKIYIHGTNLEHKLGAPKSQGCVELSNDDVMEVFDTLAVGSHVLID